MASVMFFSCASILYHFLFFPILITRKLLLSPFQEIKNETPKTLQIEYLCL